MSRVKTYVWSDSTYWTNDEMVMSVGLLGQETNTQLEEMGFCRDRSTWVEEKRKTKPVSNEWAWPKSDFSKQLRGRISVTQFLVLCLYTKTAETILSPRQSFLVLPILDLTRKTTKVCEKQEKVMFSSQTT